MHTTGRKALRGSAFIWIAYIGFIFIDPILDPRPHLWLKTLAAVAVFLPLYLWYFASCNKRSQLWLVVAMAALGAITVPWNSGGTTFFIYAAAFLPFTLSSIRWILTGFAAEILLLCAEAQWLHAPGLHVSWITVAINSFLLVMIGGGNIFFAQNRRSEAKLRLAHEEIETLAAVAERERIARDLHDVLGHTLSVIVLKAELARRLLDHNDPDAALRARNEMAEVESTARIALAEVREAIGGYRSRGLASEIESARRTLAAAGVTLHADAREIRSIGLSAAEETVLALALREAVTNIVRHAHARTCHLRFATQDGVRRLIIEDDGEAAAIREGNGLRGMRERIEGLGGRFAVEHGQGTRLELHLPTKPSPANA
ncbi:MAG TPA: sensor histidine kinase [Acidobacteriaceae bacterium]|nr:sensor histidine kinase [Acidobacteriaceae bacterium]